MSSALPSLTAKKLLRILKKKGFKKDRQRGSHLTLVQEETRKTVTVPIHTGTDIGRGLLKQILSDAGISPEEFEALR